MPVFSFFADFYSIIYLRAYFIYFMSIDNLDSVFLWNLNNILFSDKD